MSADLQSTPMERHCGKGVEGKLMSSEFSIIVSTQRSRENMEPLFPFLVDVDMD